jgi:cytochrome b561
MLALRSLASLLTAFVLAFVPIAAQAQQAADWTVDRGNSAIRFSGSYTGRAFNGSFGQWTARIRFDPSNLAGSRIIVVIDTGSATTGDRVQETTLKNGEWFDSGNHQFANFRSTAITSRGGNRYQARGTLEIKGKTTPVTLPFTLDINGNRARASGSLTLDRIALGMGTQSDPRAQYVSRNIELSINVAATRA